MIDHVSKTLKVWRTTPFTWQEHNCLLSIADYVASITGNDWGDIFRGKIDSEADALRFVEEYGGASALIDRSGLPRTTTPVRGDLVLVEIGGEYGGICTGPGVAMRMAHGVAELSTRHAKIIAAWSVPQCHL